MKLRYLRARNVLSFGDEEIKLEFSPFNIIAGPNDSGKTNIFRALSLIEKAFGYGTPPLDEILFKGDSDRSLHLEVGVELDNTERELLATLIICSEMMSVQRSEEISKGIEENKHWKNILTNYGYQILLKSLSRLSFVLTKDELRISEPKMVVQLSDGTGFLYMNRNNLLETSEEVRSSQGVSLTKEIIEDFNTRFVNVAEPDINSLIQDIQKLTSESPTLIRLLKGKLGGSPYKMVQLRGENFNQYVQDLRGEPFLTKLSRLCDERVISRERLYPWFILEQMYKTSFVRLQELRIIPPTIAYSGSSQNSKISNIFGSDLALKLFGLMCSGTRKNREKYNRIQTEVKSLTGSEFDVAIRVREATEVLEGESGVFVIPRGGSDYLVGTVSTPSVMGEEIEKRSVNEAYIQVIKDNYPVTIEQTASGLYEILFLLTIIVGENGKILLLDEPELHLHPSIQKRILNLLSQSIIQDKNQIFLITHSPYLVSPTRIDATWRFTKNEDGTKVHNIGRVFSDLESREQEKLAVKLFKPDLRSLLFSQGVILVEGPSDKIVVEQIDRHLSAKNEGANLDEREWPVINIGGKKSLLSFITLNRMLGIPNVAILDYDALMHREHIIKLNGRDVKTSTIIFTLWRIDKLKDWLSHNDLLFEVSDSDWYANAHLKNLRTLALQQDIFVFSKDLEGVLQSKITRKDSKPTKALKRILDLIEQDNISSEFYEMCEFLKKYTSP